MTRKVGRIVTVTPPAAEPVSTFDLRDHSRIDTSEEEIYLRGLLRSAVETVEEFTRRRLITQTVDEFFDEWPCGSELRLGVAPVQSVTSVKYFDEDGAEATLSSSLYVVDVTDAPALIVLKRDQAWPSTSLREVNGVVVRYLAGYGTAPSSVPARLKHAALYLAGTAYENRETRVIGSVVEEVDDTAEALMYPFRTIEMV